MQGSRAQQPPSLTTQLPEVGQKTSGTNSIASYLQIPSYINQSKGSLADFASQITCLFWFEKTSNLNTIENGLSPSLPPPPLDPEAIPSIGFRKWMTTILSTTQVSQSVILLALLFIYRLKKSNPAVRGKRGSEFRLMTIALMMGNKYLDDNTYTNKTWAEVSGISVQEIHLMEVEFLSNVRYNLFVSASQWEHWHSQLRSFAEYYERASRLPVDAGKLPVTPTLQISPCQTPTSQPMNSFQNPPLILPSPTAPESYSTPQHSRHSGPIRAQTGLSPSLLAPLAGNRKRGRGEEVDNHPAKRSFVPGNTWMHPVPAPSLPTPYSSQVTSSGLPVSASQLGVPVIAPPVPRLPRPTLPASISNDYPPTSNQLPLPNSRAVTRAYPPSTTWTQQQPPSSLAALPTTLPTLGGITESSRHTSPYSHTPCTNISPVASAYSSKTPMHLSPATLLDRNSPYRPVRNVNTLLYPVPSVLVDADRKFAMDMMHYRTLGKSTAERRTGVLPSYQPQGWIGHPPLAQPNFGGHPQSRTQP